MAQAGRDISIDGVQSLPLLKAFSQEVLRFSPPVDALSRVATHDDIIPLARPITLTDGEQVDHLAVPKGTELACAIGAFNFDEELFPEPFKFDPSCAACHPLNLTDKSPDAGSLLRRRSC
jgi:cytochrome P450